jgi:cytochrome c peroxidase
MTSGESIPLDTGDSPVDIGKFKTPSLRNVAVTAPYMHDGRVDTLDQALDLELYGRGKALNYPIVLTVSERQDLLEFLRSLTSAEPVLMHWAGLTRLPSMNGNVHNIVVDAARDDRLPNTRSSS